jgi:hypothetical protein
MLDLNRHRVAIRGRQDGDAWLEVGYCLQYGIGTRRDPTAAIRAFRRPSELTTRRRTAVRKLSIILLSRSSIVVPCGTVEKSNLCSVGRLKTATILRRPSSSSKLARKGHREFAVAVEGWHVGSAARPTARCTTAPARGPLERVERTGPTSFWGAGAKITSCRRTSCLPRLCA